MNTRKLSQQSRKLSQLKLRSTTSTPQKPITLQADVSTSGLGAVLFQEDRPVAFASRALTETES